MRFIGLIIIAIALTAVGCSGDSGTEPKAKEVSGKVAAAQSEEANDFVEFYDIFWRYNYKTKAFSIEGMLRNIDAENPLQGIALYLEADGELIGAGSGFLSFVQLDGSRSDVLRWWLVVDLDTKPERMEMFTDLRIWLDTSGVQKISDETIKLTSFVLE